MQMEKNKIYRHFKGNYYLVIDFAIDCETGEELVIYRGLYDNNELYVRKKSDFESLVDGEKYPDVSQKYRFELTEFPNLVRKKN